MTAAIFLLSLCAPGRADTLTVRLESGKTVAVHTRRPPRPGKLPALVIAGGLKTGAKALELVAPDAPAVLAAFDYPYDGPLDFRFPRTLLDAGRIKAAVRRTPEAVRASVSAVGKLPGVDPDRVCAAGVSFGAPFVLSAASRDPSLRCVVIIQGFGELEATTARRMRQLWGGKLGPLARPLAWLCSRALLLWLSPPRPEADAAALREGQRVLLVEAEKDTIVPESARRALLQALRSSRARVDHVVVPGDHLLAARSPGEQMRAIEGVVGRWLRVKTSR